MEITNINSFDDKRGSLIPIEFDSLPFKPKRVFVVNNVRINEIRGNHSHYKTKQLLICINGTVDVILHDGLKETIYSLKKNQQILIPELIWDSQKFTSENSQIMVMCSTNFDINDYIFNFETFKKIKENS